MPRAGDGWYELTTRDARAGTRYRYRIDDELTVPDPASRYNPSDVHGASEVVDPLRVRLATMRTGAAGRGTRRSIYELHVGTFTAEGTFAAVDERLDHLVRRWASPRSS